MQKCPTLAMAQSSCYSSETTKSWTVSSRTRHLQTMAKAVSERTDIDTAPVIDADTPSPAGESRTPACNRAVKFMHPSRCVFAADLR